MTHMTDGTPPSLSVDRAFASGNLSEASDPLLANRTEFPILSHTNYLISNSLGAVPSTVAASLQSYYETWAVRGVRAWEETWWTMVSELGDLVAP